MKSTFPLAVFGLLTLGTQAFAQTSGSHSNVGNLSGSISTAPATIHFGAPDASNLTDFTKFLVRRVHTIGIDGQFGEMQKSGTQSRQFVAGFTAEGAMIYNYELDGVSLKDYDQTGRNAGIELIPYRLQFNADGSKKISFSLAGLKNMNALQNSDNKWENSGIFTVLDQLDIFTFTFDQHSTFDNLNSFDLDYVRVGLKVGVAADKRGNYFAVRGGGSLGDRWQQITGGLPAPMTGIYSESSDFNGSFYGGLEANLQRKSGLKLNIQSNYVGGGGPVRLKDNARVETNIMNHDRYKTALDQWVTDKAAYEKTQGHAINDADFAIHSGSKKPVDPDNWSEKVTLTRNYGYIRNSVDLSHAVNQGGRPMRVGIGAEYSVGLRDDLTGYQDLNIDMLSHVKQKFSGKVYFNF